LGPILGPQLDVSEFINKQIEEMLIGDKDPIDAINDAAKDSNEIIAEYNRRIE
jgi:ABC-type glycerol-3-phosphate transport system substrate-binding protein